MIKDKLSLGHVWIGFIKTRITINDDDDKYTYIYNYNYVIICFFWGAQSHIFMTQPIALNLDGDPDRNLGHPAAPD